MKTVKIYMVRKPSDIDEVIELYRRYNAQAEEVTVTETVNLPPVWYDAVCRNQLDDYIFLSGKGGYDDENHRQVVAYNAPTNRHFMLTRPVHPTADTWGLNYENAQIRGY